MKTYKKLQNCSHLLVKKCNKEIWQERMNAQVRNKDLKVQKVQGGSSGVTNTLINLKNNKEISGKELKLQLSNVIKVCTVSLAFLGMANLEGDNIRRQYSSKILPPKLASLTKDVPTPSEFLLGNSLNGTIGAIETSQKMLQTYLNYYINSKNLQRFPKKTWKSKQRLQQQQQQNQRLQQPPKTTTGVSTITIPQEKLGCVKVGTTTILKFQQEIFPALNRYSEL